MTLSRGGSSSSEECEQWSQWALAQADRIDPVIGARFLKAVQDEDASYPISQLRSAALRPFDHSSMPFVVNFFDI